MDKGAPIKAPTDQIINCKERLKREYEKAIHWIESEKKSYINNKEFWYYAYYAYVRYGKYLSHIEDPFSEEQKECWPTEPNQFVNKMKCYFNLDQSAKKSYEKALKCINKYITLDQTSDAWNDKGYVLILLKKYHESKIPLLDLWN